MKIFTSSDSQIIQKHLLSTLTNFEKRVKRSDVFAAISDKISTKMEQAEFCEALSKSIRDGKIAGFEVVRGKHGGVRLVDPASAKLSLNHSELAEKAEAAPTEEVVVPSSSEDGQTQPTEIRRIKPLAQLRASDVPMGIDPYDLATDEDDAAAEAELLKMKQAAQKKVIPVNPTPKPESKLQKIIPEEKPYLQQNKAPLTTLNASKWLWINDSRYSVMMTTTVIERFLINVMRVKIDPEGSIIFNGKKYSGDEQLLHRYLTEFVGAKVDVSPPLLETTDINGVPIHFIDEVNKSPSPQALADWNKKQTVNNTAPS